MITELCQFVQSLFRGPGLEPAVLPGSSLKPGALPHFALLGSVREALPDPHRRRTHSGWDDAYTAPIALDALSPCYAQKVAFTPAPAPGLLLQRRPGPRAHGSALPVGGETAPAAALPGFHAATPPGP